ncbi:MAG: TolC family protein [Bacillota bacterium]
MLFIVISIYNIIYLIFITFCIRNFILFNGIITELFLALKNYEKKIKFYKKRIRRAKGRVELVETKYKAGRTTISDLLEKELNLRQQQIE